MKQHNNHHAARFIITVLFVGVLLYCIYVVQQNKHLAIAFPSSAQAALNAVSAHINTLTQHNSTPTSASAASGGPYSVNGKPTVSAAFINQVLAYYHSPARSLGAALFNLGIQYGINPTYALAFFMHESMFGTLGVARVTLSLGNVRCSTGYACINGYRAYSSWASGFQDWYQLIRNLYINKLHLSTVEQIIPTYAPSDDHNNVSSYITTIEQAVSDWQAGKVEVL